MCTAKFHANLVRKRIMLSYFRKIGLVIPPDDSQFVSNDNFTKSIMRRDICSLIPQKRFEILLGKGIVLRDQDLCISWIFWYFSECKREANESNLIVKFASKFDESESELNIFIRYYGKSSGSFMHRICVLNCAEGVFACKEYV